MIKNVNELIDVNLKIVCESREQKIYSHRFLDINGHEISSKNRSLEFAYELESRNLIRIDGITCYATEYGYEIHKVGGWLKYLEIQDLQSQKERVLKDMEEAKEQIKTQKLIDDSKVSKLNAKYRYVPYIFTTIGLLISIISLIVATKSKKEPITEKQLSKSEILKIIDSVSSSNQTKTADSLRNSKTQSDSLIVD